MVHMVQTSSRTGLDTDTKMLWRLSLSLGVGPWRITSALLSIARMLLVPSTVLALNGFSSSLPQQVFIPICFVFFQLGWRTARRWCASKGVSQTSSP